MAALLAHLRRAYLAGTASRGECAVTGRLVGGDMTVLRSLTNTGRLLDWDGAVVLFEDVGELPYRLERDLLQCYQAGLFKGVAGTVIGQLTNCDGAYRAGNATHRVNTLLQTHVHVPLLTEVAVRDGFANS